MNIIESLVVFAAFGALLIITIPNVIRYYWYRANNRGFIDWVAYCKGNHAYPVCVYRIGYLRRAYMLGQRQAQAATGG